MMDLKELAILLRENGDKILDALSKLSLSTSLLNDLNKSLHLIIDERETLTSTFQVVRTSNSKLEILQDLEFLYDFVQKTVGLKLTYAEQNDETVEQIDISKFKNLQLLELCRIPFEKIVGLDCLRPQLQYLICFRCVDNLKELFVKCEREKKQSVLWVKLREAVFSYNNLTYIDSSIKCMPWLQTLDLSHNSIVNAQALDCLTNLKHLNLSFNQIEAVPLFNKELSQKLQVLVLKNNYVEDLTGLLLLDNLTMLDLSCNCLVDHHSLNPLPQLAALQWLNLEGNPLSFHPQHRTLTARYLHNNTASFKFILDHSLLSKSERLLVGTFHTTISRIPGSFARLREHQSSISSNLSEITCTSEATTVESELTRSYSSKGRKIRNVVITDKEECSKDASVEKELKPPSIKEESNDHLLTKEKIEELRKAHGEKWLSSQMMSSVHEILDMKDLNQSSTPYEFEFRKHFPEILAEHQGEVKNADGDNDSKVPPAENASTNNDSVQDIDNTVTSDFSTNNTFFTAEDSETCVFEDKEEFSSGSVSVTSDDDLNEEAGEEYLYLAEACPDNGNQEEIFIVITEKYIKEQDTTTGRIKNKWLTEILKSCWVENNTSVHIEYDTVRRNMQKRKYILSDDDAQKLAAKLNEYSSKHVTIDPVPTKLCCMKCNAQFIKTDPSLIYDSNNKLECPNCKSKHIYEFDDSTPTNPTNFHNIPIFKDRPASPSECSIASECENGIAKICVTADVHRDSSVPNILPANCSAVSMEESNSSHISTEDGSNAKRLQKCESDIEIISNPSQSSIEVLEEFRNVKKLSEERKLSTSNLPVTPDVVAAVPTVFALAGLTESSSSSSFTESVCTAYDSQTVHHASRPSSGMDVRPITEETTATAPKTEEQQNKNLISSIFGGLFSRTTTGTKPPTCSIDSDASDVFFTYSDDFSAIDHRVKLHLYQSIFEEESEDFVWLLKCFLLNKTWTKPTLGCFVLTTCNVYMLYVKDHTASQDIAEWLVKKSKWTNDELISLFVLPWHQGIGIDVFSNNAADYHLAVLHDRARTSSFLTFLSSNPLPDNCALITEPIDQPVINLQQFLISRNYDEMKDLTIDMLAICKKCTVTNEESRETAFCALVLTHSDLVLLEDIAWLMPEHQQQPVIASMQPISNLIEMELEEFTLDFHFLDEVARCEEIWSMQWESTDSIDTIVAAVRTPWEEIFSVPLQVNHKVHSV